MFSTESYNEPFWAENSGFMTGRDPLGVQNSSIKTYGRLLPGMTNLTLRLRYYGFYMWVLNEYDIKIKKEGENTLQNQYNFIRRSELIIARIMRLLHPLEQSIIGSDFTKDETEIKLLGYYDIKKGADKNKETIQGSVYWDFESGALGQYYAGSLIALKLISTEAKFFIIENEGVKLAKAFDENIEKEQKIKFLKAIESGKLDIETIKTMDDFSINKLKVRSSEWEFYCSMLLGADGLEQSDNNGIATSLRKETIKLYLDYLIKNNLEYNDRSFIKWQYNLNKKIAIGDSSFGWHYYYVNEAFHIALETIFWTMLVELQSKEKAVDEFISEMTALVLRDSKSTFLPNQSTIMTDIVYSCTDYSIDEVLEILENEVKSPFNNKTAIVMAFKLILTIYANNNHRLNEIIEFEKKYKILDQKGRISENLSVYIENALQYDYEEFVKETIKKVINDHINTAYRKMGNGESNLLKFIIEDGIIYHIQTMYPRHTSPRLKALENFLRDLSLVDRDKKLTSEGIVFFNSIA